MKRLFPLLFLVACGGLEPDPGEPTLTGVVVSDVGDGTYRLEVDASDDTAWVSFDLDTRKPGGASWDLAFRRFLVKTNGGVSGDAAVRVAAITDAAFDDVTNAPATGWTEDRPSDDAPTDKPDTILESDIDHAFNQPNAVSENGWYDYDPIDHTLSPTDLVFVVESDAGRFYKLRFERYYDDAGSPAILTLRFGEVAPPNEAGLAVDASEGWTYLRIADGVVTTTAEALDWDLAFSRTIIATNGGTSGDGLGGARWTDETFDATDDISTFGFVTDEELPVPGPPGAGTISQNPVLSEWYDYDTTTHTVSPKDRVLLVRGADGESYGKLQILDYADGRFRLLLAPVTASVESATLEVEASDGGAWVHVCLTDGRVVETASASADLRWDVAFSRTRVRTNGGTSGGGDAGAIEMDTKFDDVTSAPSAGYVADEDIPLPGPPGSGTFSGNAVLNGWYDYDPMTHATTPRDVAFVVRTAHGDFVKLGVAAWADGVYTLRVAYAGPERRTF